MNTENYLLYDLFRSDHRVESVPNSPYRPSYSNNNIFSNVLNVPINNGRCFLPVVSSYNSARTLLDILGEGIFSEMVFSYPLFSVDGGNATTGPAIIKCLCNTNELYRLRKIRYIKGNTEWYVGSGLAFNKDMKPLLMCGFDININNAEPYMIENLRPVCYISPRIFTEKDLFTKYFVSKIIPFLANNNIFYPDVDGIRAFYHDWYSSRVKIIIEDFDNLFEQPYDPHNTVTMNNEIWNTLNRNINVML